MTTPSSEVRPFAIMRLTRDAIRQGMQDLLVAARELEGDAAALQKAASILAELRRCIALHAKQEDECFFKVLNERPPTHAIASGSCRRRQRTGFRYRV